jgi:magnesium transporter
VPGSFKVGSSPYSIRKYVYDENVLEKEEFFHDEKNVTLANFVEEITVKNFTDTQKCLVIINDFFDETLLTSLREKFRIHSLVLEDIVNTHQRNKYEKYHAETLYAKRPKEDVKEFTDQDYELCIIREPWNDRQISLVVMKDTVILFQESGDEACYYFVTRRIERAEGRIRGRDTGYLTFALMDSVIDDYFSHVDKLEEEVEQMERNIEDGKEVSFNDISTLKRKVIDFRKNTVSLREMTIRMASSDDSLLNRDPRNLPFFTDLMDHATRVSEHAEKLRETASGLVGLQDAVTSAKTNSVMNLLTVMTTIFVPVTFISQVYGMNFEGIEEIHWKHGYLIFWLVVLGIAGLVILFFAKKKWIKMPKLPKFKRKGVYITLAVMCMVAFAIYCCTHRF